MFNANRSGIKKLIYTGYVILSDAAEYLETMAVSVKMF